MKESNELYNNKNKNLIVYLYLGFYLILNLIFLTKFPAMHSDESWLSGLSRSMMNSNLGATEYFFDLVPRYPHAIKTIYHIVQILFIKIFGYSLFSVRLISLLFGILSLYFFFNILCVTTKSFKLSFTGMLILSFDIQFIYASHFARQEMVIVAFMLFGIYYIVTNIEKWTTKKDIIAGAIIGLSIGIHPNSFLFALIIGSVYLYYILFKKKLKLKNLAFVIFTTAVFASIFIGLSFYFNSTFIRDYLKYGDDLGATANGIMKIFAFPGYYKKLFDSFSVTYYTPTIKIQFFLFALGILGAIISWFIRKNRKGAMLFIFPIIALNIGYIIIGRYSQPGIILLFPLCYLLIFYWLGKFKKHGFVTGIMIGLLISGNSIVEIAAETSNDYKEYVSEIQNVVPRDAEILANLNAEYAFDYNKLHDYRNLDKLGDIEFSEYIYSNSIEYIIYPQEMDYIYNNRPVWNVMYGNVYPYYQDMIDFMNDDCEMVYEFCSPYAMRILMYSDDADWAVKIYKVKVTEEIE